METMLDVKKLITGFLILALGASTAAWILSGTNTAIPATQTAGVSSAPTVDNNAFLPTDTAPQDVASLIASQSLSSSTEASLEKPGNLTGALADSLLNNLVASNPDGIQTDANNNQTVNQPDDNAILAELQSNPAASQISIPNWDVEAARVPIQTTNSVSETAAANYSGAVDQIFNNSFVQNGVQGMVNDAAGGDTANAAYIQSSVTSALNSSAKLQTPANLADFQKSLVKLLVYEKNSLALAANANADPVKTSIVFQNEQLKYNVALGDFQNQFEKAQNVKGFSLGGTVGKNESNGIAFLNSLLGIKTAHAQWLTFDAANFGQLILHYVNNIILQILKNVLISFIQNKVLRWISGSGAPLFVQNWADDLVNAAQTSAVNAINSNYSCINTNTVFPRIQVILNAIYKPGNNVCAAQFQSQLGSGNLTNFFNNFSNGGFVTFGQTLLPSNNLYSGLFVTAQNAGQAAQQGQGVFSLKTTSQQGLKGIEKCADGSNPSGISKTCVQQTDYGTSIEATNSDGTCNSGWTLQASANNGKCADGTDPTTNSPGQVTGQVFKTSLEGSPQLVTAANDITGLLNAMLGSLLNGLASMAVTAGTNAAEGGIGIGAGSSNGGGLTSLAGQASTNTTPVLSGLPAQPGVSCAPLTQTATLDTGTGQASVTLYAQGGATNVSSSASGASDNGQPTYTWSAPGSVSSGGGASAGDGFVAIYNATGTYSVAVTASTDSSNASCSVTVQ